MGSVDNIDRTSQTGGLDDAMVFMILVTSGITNGAPSVQRVLLLGPDDEARRALHLMLDRAGRQVAAMTDVEGARRYFASNDCDAVIAVAEHAPRLVRDGAPPVIAVVGDRDPERVRVLLEQGIADIVIEPVDELGITLALRHVSVLPARTKVPTASSPLVGDSEPMQKLREMIERIATTKSTALVLGESGTGKELVARSIHEHSPRYGRFVAINCAAIPATLLESELFGHTRGAFTDAVRDKTGLFEDADGGTLFLDEVGELPLALQAKLLRALQEGEIRRLGDTANVKVDVRLIAATLRDLAEDVTEGRFREDLYYRLNVLPIRIPPLRERAEDIPQLARFFTARHAQRHRLGEITLDDTVIDVLRGEPWPGNVRELENMIERVVVLADKPVIDLPFLASVMNLKGNGTNGTDLDGLSIKKATRELEDTLIRRALVETSGNRTNAAKLLEISHRALLYKMKEYGIS